MGSSSKCWQSDPSYLWVVETNFGEIYGWCWIQISYFLIRLYIICTFFRSHPWPWRNGVHLKVKDWRWCLWSLWSLSSKFISRSDPHSFFAGEFQCSSVLKFPCLFDYYLHSCIFVCVCICVQVHTTYTHTHQSSYPCTCLHLLVLSTQAE